MRWSNGVSELIEVKLENDELVFLRLARDARQPARAVVKGGILTVETEYPEAKEQQLFHHFRGWLFSRIQGPDNDQEIFGMATRVRE